MTLLSRLSMRCTRFSGVPTLSMICRNGMEKLTALPLLSICTTSVPKDSWFSGTTALPSKRSRSHDRCLRDHGTPWKYRRKKCQYHIHRRYKKVSTCGRRSAPIGVSLMIIGLGSCVEIDSESSIDPCDVSCHQGRLIRGRSIQISGRPSKCPSPSHRLLLAISLAFSSSSLHSLSRSRSLDENRSSTISLSRPLTFGSGRCDRPVLERHSGQLSAWGRTIA